MDNILFTLGGFVVGAIGMFFFYRKHMVRVEAELMNAKILIDDLKKKITLK